MKYQFYFIKNCIANSSDTSIASLANGVYPVSISKNIKKLSNLLVSNFKQNKGIES